MVAFEVETGVGLKNTKSRFLIARAIEERDTNATDGVDNVGECTKVNIDIVVD